MKFVREWWREMGVVALLLSAIFVWYVIANERRAGILTINFLDVGSGGAALVQGPSGLKVLVNGGPGRAVLEQLGAALPFYDHALDVVLATHNDSVHLEGLVNVLRRYDVGLFISPPFLPDAPGQALADELRRKGVRELSAQTGQVLPLGRGARLRLVAAAPVRVLVEYGKTSIPITGDQATQVAGHIYNPRYLGRLTVTSDGQTLEVATARTPGKLANAKVAELLSAAGSLSIDERAQVAGCHTNGPFPDHACTPGAIFENATVDQVCVSGYTKNVRNVPVALKREVYAEYRISYPQARGSYEADHLIPLELGGNNAVANLWPEAAAPTPGFREKDLVENYLHQEVCAGRADLLAVQRQIANDWLSVYNALTPEQIAALKKHYNNWSDN